MLIGIDARWMVGQYRGMGRFAHQLIAPVRKQVVGLVPADLSDSKLPLIAHGKSFFPFWEQVELPRIATSQEIEWLVCPYNTGPIRKLHNTRVIAVIHDLIFMEPWHELPPSISPYQTLGRLYRRQVVPRFAKQADIIVTVSDYTASLLVDKLDIDSSRITVIPNAVGDTWLSTTPVAIDKRKNYFLTVTGEAPSKNLNRLILAYARGLKQLPKPFQLKVVGVSRQYHKKFAKIAKDHGIQKNVEFISFISEKALKDLYKQAKGFIFPSLYEGFGIPLLEAMACGTPIACSDRTSIPEVVGECAEFFNPENIDSISNALVKLCNCNEFVWQRVENGLQRSVLFSNQQIKNKVNDFWVDLGVVKQKT